MNILELNVDIVIKEMVRLVGPSHSFSSLEEMNGVMFPKGLVLGALVSLEGDEQAAHDFLHFMSIDRSLQCLETLEVINSVKGTFVLFDEFLAGVEEMYRQILEDASMFGFKEVDLSFILNENF